jgi:type II secretory pathway pseudopilin PulG
MRRTGVTFIELMIVVAIVLFLAGLVFVAAAPGRERARQTVCGSQLRQIHTAMQLYSVDFPEAVYGSSVTFISTVGEALEPYGYGPSLAFCPDAPGHAREFFASTYYWNTMLGPPGNEEWEARREVKLQRMLSEGPSYVVVECDVHDEVYYQPREVGVDPSIIGTFRLQLSADGAIHRRRVEAPRTQLFLGRT